MRLEFGLVCAQNLEIKIQNLHINTMGRPTWLLEVKEILHYDLLELLHLNFCQVSFVYTLVDTYNIM